MENWNQGANTSWSNENVRSRIFGVESKRMYRGYNLIRMRNRWEEAPVLKHSEGRSLGVYWSTMACSAESLKTEDDKGQ
jgi:hypothetical protein